jgi:integrase
MQSPYYSRTRKAWFLKITLENGKRSQVKLGETKRAAFDKFRKMQEAATKRAAAGVTIDEAVQAYCSFARREVAEGKLRQFTLDGYVRYLARFMAAHGAVHVSELTPHHVTEWITTHGWKSSSERAAIAALKRCLNWCAGQQLIPLNPIASMRRPKTKRRTQLIDTATHAAMVAHVGAHAYAGKIDRQFRLVLIAIRQCGGRPQDVAQARVEFVDRDVTTWTLPEHKTKRHTDAPRVVYLSPCLRTVTRMLIAGRTEGPLFRGKRGGITTNAIKCRMTRLREALGLPPGTVAYAYRHSYITDALINDVDAATIATLTGTSIEMIERHYGHIGKHDAHLREAAARAVRRG